MELIKQRASRAPPAGSQPGVSGCILARGATDVIRADPCMGSADSDIIPTHSSTPASVSYGVTAVLMSQQRERDDQEMLVDPTFPTHLNFYFSQAV